MDLKRAMLYPDPNAVHTPEEQERAAAAAASIGLPVDTLPPSYAAATSSVCHPVPFRPPNHEIKVVMPSAPNLTIEDTGVTSIEPRAGVETAINRSSTSIRPSETEINPPVFVMTQRLGPDKCFVTCPVCGNSGTSRMTFTPNTRTHLCALGLALIGWCVCACILPYCMKSCRTGNHYCSKCDAFLGIYQS